MNDESIAAEPIELNRVTGKKCLLVLGMHRSGTSALSGVLSLLGCQLPRKIREAKDDNPKGFFESHPISRFNESIFKSAGTSWDDWQTFNESWYASPVFVEYLAQAKSLISEEFLDSSLIVHKDPRICRLVPFWAQALRISGYEPLVVQTIRNPLEVALSLESRNDIEPSLSMLVWLRYNLDAEYHSRGFKRVYTSYPGLLRNWSYEVENIQNRLELKLPRISTRAGIEIEDFLSLDLRHHSIKPSLLLDTSTYSNWFRECFEIFEGWSRKGENRSDLKKLDQINRDFTNASPAFGRLIEAGKVARKVAAKGREFEANLLESQQEVHQQKNRNEALQTQKDGLESRLTDLEARSHELSKKFSALEAEKLRVDSEFKQHVSRSQNELLSALRRVDGLSQSLKERHHELARLATVHITARTELKDCEAKLKEKTDAARFDLLACIADIGRQYRLLGRFTFFRDRKILKSSILFDESWYLSEYTDVRDAGLDPVSHYLLNGCGEGRDPSKEFQSVQYYQKNRDVLSKKMNALVHYVRFGQFEDDR